MDVINFAALLRDSAAEVRLAVVRALVELDVSGDLDFAGIILSSGAAADLTAAALRLVERFDTEFNHDFSAKSPNFRGLALFCIEADFCTQIRILQHFSRTVRFAILCTCLLYTSPSPRDATLSRMPSSA